jgi:hypothetical protein
VKRVLSILVVLAASALCSPAPAHAGHGDASATVHGTAHVLGARELQVGLWKLEYGLPGRLRGTQIGTYTAPWFLWAGQARMVNGHVKRPIWSNDRWSVSGSLGFFYMNLENLVDTPVTFVLVPMDLYVTHHIGPEMILTVRGTYTAADIGGYFDEEEEVGVLRGAVASENIQAAASLLWRWSRLTMLGLELRVSHILGLGGVADGSLRVDEHTRVDFVATGDTSLKGFTGGSVSGRVHWSWDRFNLRLGLTYGHYNIGGINVIVPAALPMPELDLFWRF